MRNCGQRHLCSLISCLGLAALSSSLAVEAFLVLDLQQLN
jgi:hypothetical protein